MKDEEFIEYAKKFEAANAYRERQQRRARNARRRQLKNQAKLLRIIAEAAIVVYAIAMALTVSAQSAPIERQTPQEAVAEDGASELSPQLSPPVSAAQTPAEAQSEPLPLAYLGSFTVTHYCPCRECCGKEQTHPLYGITATGTKATEGRTVAVDSALIPHGSTVAVFYDDGRIVQYIAEDSGVYGQHLDVFVNDHARAAELGVETACVYLVNKEVCT